MPTSKYSTSNEFLICANISVEDTVDNTVEGIFSDVTQFYIYEHQNTFSKYFIIIQNAYKYGASLLFNNKWHVKLWNVIQPTSTMWLLMGVGYLTNTSISGSQWIY